MRYGDFAIEIVPAGPGSICETTEGHVLARPGQVYAVRLRNLGPLFCVADVRIDGLAVTGGGLVLRPFSTTDLERPVDGTDTGRFTVTPEGNERVFGPDGGRDNADLGLVRAAFRRELPRESRPTTIAPTSYSFPETPRPLSRPHARPTWTALNRMRAYPELPHRITEDSIERAAGTGLTGHSDQQFSPIMLADLEQSETVLTLRIVIGSEAAIAAATAAPPPDSERVPPRPAARP